MDGLTDADAKALVAIAAERIVDDNRVAERITLNRIVAPPHVVQLAIRTCKVAMEHDALTMRIPMEDLRMLAPIADLISDIINDEVGEPVGFVLTGL